MAPFLIVCMLVFGVIDNAAAQGAAPLPPESPQAVKTAPDYRVGPQDVLNITVTADHWLDVNARSANKGAAVSALQAAYGITPAQTMVFGDFLNDLEMMDTADYSFAMNNAHPLLAERARYVAPPNSDNGVVRTIASVLGISVP